MLKHLSLRLCIVLTSFIFVISACTVQVSGKTKEDSTWSAETRQLESEAAAYSGPQYTIGIVPFANKATVMLSGVSGAMAHRLKTQLEATGLSTIPLDDRVPKGADTTKASQPSGAIKNEKKRANNSFEALDFSLSGTVSSYSEVDEWMDATATQKKSVVARVAVDYVLIEAATGKQLMAESVSGEFRKPPTGALKQTARISFDSNLRDGALRNALAKATVKITRKLSSMPFQGKLLGVDGSSLVLKAGLRSRLREGTQLAVYRVSKAIVDQDNGRVLGYRESRIGVIQISNHLNENLSAATVASGTGFQAGDVAKLIP